VWLIILWRGWWWKLMIHTSIWFFYILFFFLFPVFSEFNRSTDGFLHDLWMSFYNMYYKYISMQERTRLSSQTQVINDGSMLVNGSCFIVQLSHTLLNFQVPNIGAIMDNIPQITREGYFIRHLARKFLFSTSWLHSAYTC
jgi:hypothetical protein